MSTLSRLVGAIAATVLIGGLTAVSASAAVLSKLHFESSGSEPFTFCEGIDAEVSWHDNVHELVKTRGRDGLVYFSANVRGTTTYTNLDTGKTYTNVYHFTDRDQQVTDNGNGTLTITIASPGSDRWYGSDGKLLFVSAGTFWFQILVDHGGTPADPSDDEEIEGSFVGVRDVGLRGTAGRDFCEDLAQFTA
jgi:hypothetical protein